MNTYDMMAERFYAAVHRIGGEYLHRKWVPVETKKVLEAEIYHAARDAAYAEGGSMDAAYAMAAFALWTMVFDHPLHGRLPFRDMP